MYVKRLIAPRRRLGVVALVVVAASVGLPGCSSDGSEATPDGSATTAATPSTNSEAKVGPVAEFSGSGDETTETFRAAANWELRWRVAEGGPFAIELLTKDGESRGRIVDGGDNMEGTTFVSDEGEFKLNVSAGGDWSVQLLSRPVDG